MKNLIKKLAAISLAIAIISSLTVSVSAFGFYEIEYNDDISAANGIIFNAETHGNLNTEEDVDYYHFSILEPSKVEIDLPEIGTEGIWRFSLLNENNTTFTNEEYYDFGCKGKGEIETLRLPIGTYYICVKETDYYGYYSNEEYKFTVNTTVENDNFEKETNDTFSSANSISTDTTIYGNLNTYDDVDYYSFTLDEPSKVEIDLPKFGTEGEWKFSLLNENNATFTNEEDYVFGCDGEGKIETLRLSAGTYYICVKETGYYGSYSNDDYRFTINTTVENDNFEKETNDTFSSANSISTDTTIYGNLNTYDDVDYYSFTLDELSKVEIDLPKFGTEGEWNFSLLNENNATFTNEEDYVFGCDGEGEIETLRLSAGTYYIRVKETGYYGSYSNDDYRFTVNVTKETQVQKAPAKPTGLKISASASGITIKWSSVSKAKGYKIYKATSKNGKYTLCKTTTSTSYTDKSVEGGKKYFYKVKAYGSNSVESVFSATKSIKAKAKIAAPTKITCSSKLIKWNKAKNAKKYQIKVYDNTKKSKLVFSSETKKTSIKAKFTKNHKYLIKIRSVSGSGKSQVYSEYKTYTYKSK